MRRIHVQAPRLLSESAVRIRFTATGGADADFVSDHLDVRYSVDVDSLGAGVLVIPLLANIAPVAWATNTTISVAECDETFAGSLSAVRDALAQLYPTLPLAGALEVDSLTRPPRARGGSGALYSGGVDSTATVLAHQAESPELFTIVQAPPSPANLQLRLARDLAATLGSSSVTVHAPIMSGLLDRHRLSLRYRKHDIRDWWTGVQYALGLTGVCAPAATALGLSKLYVAGDSEPDKEHGWGSSPTLDNSIAWASTQVIHDLGEVSRMEKVRRIVAGAGGMLYVCGRRDGNCGQCEKCVRTMMAIALAGADPGDWGFPSGEATARYVQSRLRKGTIEFSSTSGPFWAEMRAVAIERPATVAAWRGPTKELASLAVEKQSARYERRMRVLRRAAGAARFLPRPLYRRLHRAAKSALRGRL